MKKQALCSHFLWQRVENEKVIRVGQSLYKLRYHIATMEITFKTEHAAACSVLKVVFVVDETVVVVVVVVVVRSSSIAR